MRSSKSTWLVLFAFSMIWWGCAEEKRPTGEMILGTWSLKLATRNDNITNSLDGMYMNFENDKSFDSNILGDTSSFSTQIEHDRIIIDHDMIRQFEIVELTDSTMKLQFEINDDELKLVFIK